MHGTMKKQFRSGFKKAKDYDGLKRAMYNVYPNAEKVGRGSLRTLTKLLDENQALSRRKTKAALTFVREFKAEAEAIMNEEDHKAKISDFQLFKWIEGAFEPSTRKQVHMRMMLNGKPEEVEVLNMARPSGSGGSSASGSDNTAAGRRFRTVRKQQAIDWNEFDDWCWYIDEMIAYLNDFSDDSLSYGGGKA
jgi:hypothetical protein